MYVVNCFKHFLQIKKELTSYFQKFIKFKLRPVAAFFEVAELTTVFKSAYGTVTFVRKFIFSAAVIFITGAVMIANEHYYLVLRDIWIKFQNFNKSFKKISIKVFGILLNPS